MVVNIEYIIVALAVILISMTLHELMHGYVAYWLGDDTAKLQGRLTLNPLKHLDPFMSILLPLGLALVGAPIFGGAKPVPFNPNQVKGEEWGAALVALAGPLTNFFLAFISFGIWMLCGSPTAGFAGMLFTAFVSVNLGFFIFNLIPIPPLDGSRVIYALAPDFIRRGMELMERYGLLVVFVIVLLGSSVIGSMMSVAIAYFIHLFAVIFTL